MLGREASDISWFPWRTVLSTWHDWVAGGEADWEVPGRLVTSLSDEEFRMAFEVDGCTK